MYITHLRRYCNIYTYKASYVVYVSSYTYSHTYIYINTNIYTHIDTYIPTYTPTCILSISGGVMSESSISMSSNSFRNRGSPITYIVYGSIVYVKSKEMMV